MVLTALAIVVTVLVVTRPSDSDRVAALGERIRCPVCQGESIADSPSSLARDMMALVEDRVAESRSDEEILDELLSSYSDAVLLDPPASGATLVLWLAPLGALMVGVVVIVWWRRHPGDETPPPLTDGAAPRSRRRIIVGGLVLTAAFAGIVVMAGFFLQDRGGPASGAADLSGQDLSEVSNQTMEAVIGANLDNPQISGMRLALAERYFDEGDYQSAFDHYMAVARSPTSTDAQAITALIRLGWMAWDGSRAADAALGMFDQALAIDPSSTTALYLKGQVLWCGKFDPDQAARLFDEILGQPSIDQESRDQVRADVAAIDRGETCQ